MFRRRSLRFLLVISGLLVISALAQPETAEEARLGVEVEDTVVVDRPAAPSENNNAQQQRSFVRLPVVSEVQNPEDEEEPNGRSAFFQPPAERPSAIVLESMSPQVVFEQAEEEAKPPQYHPSLVEQSVLLESMSPEVDRHEPERAKPPEFHPSLVEESIDHDDRVSSSQAEASSQGRSSLGNQQQPPANMEQLQQRLQDLDDVEEPDDDRTLLDVFGEYSKEYLTQRVIPDTDVECRWDWRSIRCEPACRCAMQPKRGDYHLGRACRLRQPALMEDCNNIVWSDRAAMQRVRSLVLQTSEIVRERIGVVLTRVQSRWQRLRNNVCNDLWQLALSTEETCLPKELVPVKTIPERLLCGHVEFQLCDDEDERDAMLREAWSDL